MSGKIIKIGIGLAIIGLLAFVSMQKINAMVLSDFDVINHQSLYAKNGFPVYSMPAVQPEQVYFITDIAFTKDNSTNANTYTAYVDEDKRKALKVGNEVFVAKEKETLSSGFNRINAEEKYYMGKITAISNSRDWQTGLYRVNVLMNTALPKEPFYSAKAVTNIMKNIVVAPISTFESTGGKYYAWTIEKDNTAKRTELTIGICDGYNCQILSGLNKDDLLITSDLKKLEEGLLLNNRGMAK